MDMHENPPTPLSKNQTRKSLNVDKMLHYPQFSYMQHFWPHIHRKTKANSKQAAKKLLTNRKGTWPTQSNCKQFRVAELSAYIIYVRKNLALT